MLEQFCDFIVSTTTNFSDDLEGIAIFLNEYSLNGNRDPLKIFSHGRGEQSRFIAGSASKYENVIEVVSL